MNKVFDQVAAFQKLWAGGMLNLLTETFDEYMRTLNGALNLKRTALGINVEEPRLDTYKVGTLEAPSGGAVNLHTIKGQVAVITGAAGGIGHALALDMARRGAAGMALVDFSDRVVQVAREINTEAGHQVAIAYRGDTTDTAFREEVYTDLTSKAGVPRICVPAAAITKDALAVRIDKQTGEVVTYPMEDFRKVVEVNMIAPIYWAIELVAAVAKDRASRGLKRWRPEEGLQGAVVFLGSIASVGNVGQISYSSTKAGLEGAEEIADAICFMLTNAAVSGELWADAGWRPAA